MRVLSAARWAVVTVLIGLLPNIATAISKTITVNPKVPVQAVTTWYYASCTASAGIGSYSIITAPIHGTVSYGQVSGPLPGCPAGSPALPAIAAFYDWTDTTIKPPASDFFSLLYQAPDGETEVEDVTVELPACAISIQTLATVPAIDSQSRSTIGVGEAVSLFTNIPVTWSATSLGYLSAGTVPLDVSRRNGENFPSEDCAPQTSPPAVGNEACYKAPYGAGVAVVTATATPGGESCYLTLTTVQPQNLIMTRLQYPSRTSPDDYSFFKEFFGHVFEMQMETAIFATPANVSFSYIHFEERDRLFGNYFGFAYNSLYNVNGTNGWLLNCDYDHQRGIVGYADSRDDNWEFGDWNDGNLTPFATEETTWSESEDPAPNGQAQFSKFQTAVINPDGTTTPTPGAPASTLTVPAVNFNDFRGVGDHKECEAQLAVDGLTQIQ